MSNPVRRSWQGFLRLRRRYRWLLGLGLVTLISVLVLFNPALQKRALLKYASPYFERLAVESFHVLPWSIRITGFNGAYEGASFNAQLVRLKFCLSSLVHRTLELQALTLENARLDLRQYRAAPPTPRTEPFPGVFATLDTGFDFAIGEVEADLKVHLANADELLVRLHDGGIAPHSNGFLTFTGQYDAVSLEPVDFEGRLSIDQIEYGRFNEIALQLEAATDIGTERHPEYSNLSVVFRPSANPPRLEVAAADGNKTYEPLPDLIDLRFAQTDADKFVRAKLQLDAQYDSRTGVIAGDYGLESNDKLPAPYLGEQPIPKFQQAARGSFTANVVSLLGELTLQSQTALSDLAAVLGDGEFTPKSFMLMQNATVSFSPEQVTIENFHAKINDENGATRVDTSTTNALTIDLADPAAALRQAATLLTLDISGILLSWFDALLPDYAIRGGEVTGAFEVVSSEAGHIVIAPRDKLALSGVRIEDRDGVLVDNLNIVLTPRVEITDEATNLSIKDLLISVDGQAVAGFEITASQTPGTDEEPLLKAQIAGHLELDPLLAQPAFGARVEALTLPAGLTLEVSSTVARAADAITVTKLHASVAHGDNPKLLDVTAKQAFTIKTTADGSAFQNPKGTLATVVVNDLKLDWLTPFTAPYELAGVLKRAQFALSANGDKLMLEPGQAFEIADLRVTEATKTIVDELFIRVNPHVVYAPGHSEVRYDGLAVAAGRRQLVRGSGAVSVTSVEQKPPAIEASGDLELKLNNLARLPIIAAMLPDDGFDTPLDTAFSYRIQHEGTTTRLGAIDLDLLHEKKAFLNLQSRSGLTVKTTLGPDEKLAQHAVGAIRLSINDMSPAPLRQFLAGGGLNFDSINGAMTLVSDGERLTAESDKALEIANLQLNDADGKPIVHPMDIRTLARLATSGQELEATLDELSVKFRRDQAPALSGKLSATVEPQRTIPLRKLRATLTGALVSLFDQPVVLPGHALTAGQFHTRIEVDPDGRIAADTTIDGLASKKKLAIHTFSMPLAGNVRTNGKGFDFSMPIIGTGKSGTSNAVAKGAYAPKGDQAALLQVQLQSDVFYLNDILATIDGIKRPVPKAAPDATTAGAAVVVDDTPDESAFWNVLPYDTRVDFEFKRVFYSDYVAFTDITGSADLLNTKLKLNDFSAFFHESPITINGGFDFTDDTQEPYTAKLAAKIKDFDLNQFFTELAPTKKSRIKGLFGIKVAVSGQAPNAAQFRNRLLLDLKMNSRDGLFRPLPPDSVLMAGASDALGIIGEGLSYVPTGGFGAGAVSRLVNYIAEIHYDSVDVHIKRDQSLDLKVKRADMLSPTIRMAATGVIKHEYGKDVLDSPLDLTAHLNATGKGAAILYSMNLMTDQQDKFGYDKGPEIKLSGSVLKTESNFAEIIQRAADGTVKGGITRPLSGLIGNLKYRWFGGDAEVDAAKQEISQELSKDDAASAPAN